MSFSLKQKKSNKYSKTKLIFRFNINSNKYLYIKQNIYKIHAQPLQIIQNKYQHFSFKIQTQKTQERRKEL